MPMTENAWTESSYCSNGTCLSVRRADVVQVRDLKDPASPVLSFGPDRWAQFVAAVVDGRVSAGQWA